MSQGKEVGFHLLSIALLVPATFQLAVVVRLLTSLPTLVFRHLKRQLHLICYQEARLKGVKLYSATSEAIERGNKNEESTCSRPTTASLVAESSH